MNTNKEVERIVSDWLENRVADPPHGSLRSALARADQTPQQRHRWLPRWFGRGRGATGGADARDRDDPSNDRRNRLMFSATAVAAGVAALALAATLVVPQGAGEPVPAPGAAGPTHRVAADGSGDFQTINEALAAAEEGDTILVAPGTYSEYLFIDKDITLAGDGPREEIVVEFPEGGPVYDPWGEGEEEELCAVPVVLEGSDASLRGLTIRGQLPGCGIYVMGGAPELAELSVAPDPQTRTSADDDAPDFMALVFEDGSRPVVRDNSWTGRFFSGGSSPTIEGNTITSGSMPLDGPGEAVVRGNTFLDGRGIRADIDLTGVIEDNDLRAGTIHIGEGTSMTVRDNILREGRFRAGAILVERGGTAHIVANTVADHGIGIHVDLGGVATIEGNDLTDNDVAVRWESAEIGAIDGNTVRGGETGIAIVIGDPSVVDNTVEGASLQGIRVGGGTPTIEGNTICGSETNLVVGSFADPVIGVNEICPDGAAPAA